MRGLVCWVVVGGGLSLSSAAWGQCTKDTDCKGDRICEEGKCMSPPPAPPAPVAAPASGGAAAVAPSPSAATAEPPPNAAQPPPAVPPPPAPSSLPPIAGEVGVEASYALAAPNAAPNAAPSGAASVEPSPEPRLEPVRDERPALRRRNRAAMTAGIVMTAAAPIALLGALIARSNQTRCDEDLQNEFPGHIVPNSERYRVERCDDYSVPVYTLGIGGLVLGAVGIPLIIYGGRRVPEEAAPRVSISPWATPTAGGLRVGYAL